MTDNKQCATQPSLLLFICFGQLSDHLPPHQDGAPRLLSALASTITRSHFLSLRTYPTHSLLIETGIDFLFVKSDCEMLHIEPCPL